MPGGLNINNASIPVLAAMLSGSYTDAADTRLPKGSATALSALNQTTAVALATKIYNYLRANRATNTVYDPSDIPALSDGITAITANGVTSPIPMLALLARRSFFRAP